MNNSKMFVNNKLKYLSFLKSESIVRNSSESCFSLIKFY